MRNRFQFYLILFLICFAFNNCNKEADTYQYFFSITINGQTISDTWERTPDSKVYMGADLDPGIVAGVSRLECETTSTTCYRFALELSETRNGSQVPARLEFDIKNGSATDMTITPTQMTMEI